MQANRAIIETLLYSNIFDFPLRKEEIWLYLISKKKISYSEFQKALDFRQGYSYKSGYYFISGKENIVEKRLSREKHSKKQIELARKVLSSIASLPTVNLIGLSGSLALSASDEKDDIDVFVIAEKNTVWLSRLIIVIFLSLKGIYRKRGDNNASGKFCLNMIIGEDFNFPSEKQDIYTAHEIAQLLPLFNKNNAYQKFLFKNKWLLRYMPNVAPNKASKSLKKGRLSSLSLLIIKYLFFERIAVWTQKVYMGKITKEIVGDNILAFHPVDYQTKILKAYKNSKK